MCDTTEPCCQGYSGLRKITHNISIPSKARFWTPGKLVSIAAEWTILAYI